MYRCDHRVGEWRHKSRPGAPLGKQDRRWLSHYQAMKEQSILNSRQPKILLQEALQNANQLLELVLEDHSSISQALKMTQKEDSSSLRWYTLSVDVAIYVQKGLVEVPGTIDRDNIIGAIRPLAWCLEEEKISTNHRPSRTLINSTIAETFQFQDNGHSGAAPLDEIEQGYEDEELSDGCLIFNPKSDTWDAIGVFLQSRRSETTKMPMAVVPTYKFRTKTDLHNQQSNGECAMESPPEAIEEIGVVCKDREIDLNSDGLENIDSCIQQESSVTINDEKVEGTFDLMAYDLPVAPKNEKKKPQRDSSAWGRGSMVTLGGSETVRAVPTKRKKSNHIKPPPKLMRLVTQAMIQWDMIEEGDRLLLGLSGGKDSLSLLHILLEFKKKLPIRFEIEVCTIDPMTSSFDPSVSCEESWLCLLLCSILSTF